MTTSLVMNLLADYEMTLSSLGANQRLDNGPLRLEYRRLL